MFEREAAIGKVFGLFFQLFSYLDKHHLVEYLSDNWEFKVWHEENLQKKSFTQCSEICLQK